MRIVFLLGWMLIPCAVGAYHYGPGQAQMKLDNVNKYIAAAREAEDAEAWTQTVQLYNDALAMIPAEQVQTAREVRLERNKAMMFCGELPEAYLDLQTLLAELSEDKKADPEFEKEVRSAMANAEYYVTWTLRLEGLGKEDWEPIIESSRQNYRLLAEAAADAGDETELKEQQENLEAVIRLANLDMEGLQAIPIPKQCNCNGSCSGCCKKPGNGKKPNKGKHEKREKDNRGASSGPPPDKSGS